MIKIQKITIAVLIFFISSCDQIYFDKPQPIDTENLKSIPKELQGIWTDKNATITINDSSYQLIEYRKDTLYKKEVYSLSDSVVLRKAGNLYVANIKRDNWWELFIIQKNHSNEILGYYPNPIEVSKNKKIIFQKKEKDAYSHISHYVADLKSNEIRKLNSKHVKRFVILKPDLTMSNDALNN